MNIFNKVFLFSIFLIVNLAAQEISSFPIKRELTTTKLVFPDKITLKKFDDPEVDGVTCYVSSTVIGGVSGAIGIAEDPSEFSISCVKNKKITIKKIDLSPKGEVVFSERQSLIFKKLKVRRIFDQINQVLIYVVFSERILNGSYNNVISTIYVND